MYASAKTFLMMGIRTKKKQLDDKWMISERNDNATRSGNGLERKLLPDLEFARKSRSKPVQTRAVHLDDDIGIICGSRDSMGICSQTSRDHVWNLSFLQCIQQSAHGLVGFHVGGASVKNPNCCTCRTRLILR